MKELIEQIEQRVKKLQEDPNTINIGKVSELTLVKMRLQKVILYSVGICPFEAYAVFCIECDRQGMKPIKHKDYLNLG